MRKAHLLPLVCLLVACKNPLLAPASASVPFTSARFHFSYTPPSTLGSIDIATLNLKKQPFNAKEVLVYSARDPSRPYGVVIIAEKMNVPTPHNPEGFQNGHDFIKLIPQGIDTDQSFEALKEIHVVTPNGLTVDQYDYKYQNDFDSGLAFPVKTADGDYLIVFKCNAATGAELDAMTASVRASHPA